MAIGNWLWLIIIGVGLAQELFCEWKTGGMVVGFVQGDLGELPFGNGFHLNKEWITMSGNLDMFLIIAILKLVAVFNIK